MATKSFIRTIVISDKKAIDKLNQVESSKNGNSKINSIILKYNDQTAQKMKKSTINNILSNH